MKNSLETICDGHVWVSWYKKNSFVIAFGDGKDGVDLRDATVLLLIRIGVRESNKRQKFAVLQYTDVTSSLDTVEGTFRCGNPK